MLELLLKDENATFILTSGNNPDRYVSYNELYEYMRKYVKNNRIQKKEIENAIHDAMNSDNKTVNFVVGSFYTYGTVVTEIEKLKNHP